MARAPSPIEPEFRRLYDQVWAGFTQEESQSYPDTAPTGMSSTIPTFLSGQLSSDFEGENSTVRKEKEGEWERMNARERASEYEYGYDFDSQAEDSFINLSLLSHLAVQLRDKVPRGTHVKGSIPYPGAFTGRDIVSTFQTLIAREHVSYHRLSSTNLSFTHASSDRGAALHVARSLRSQLFFYEVDWGAHILQDGVEDVYLFLNDPEGPGPAAELPTGVITMLTQCYVPTCVDDGPCYAFDCPKRSSSIHQMITGHQSEPAVHAAASMSWPETVPEEVLERLPESEINRQTIIHRMISKEAQYLFDLYVIESFFIRPLRIAHPPIISPPSELDRFIELVIGNLLELRECNKRLLEVMRVRQREQQYVIQGIGDVFLTAAIEFRLVYPDYIGGLRAAEKRLKDEMEGNPQFRLFLEQISRQQSDGATTGAPRLDLKYYLNRPSEHLQKYPVLLDAILHETAEVNPDTSYLREAIKAVKGLQCYAQLRTFQSAMCRGFPGTWEWFDLVSADVKKEIPKGEAKRQATIFELIKGEMAYVKYLENVELMYVSPLRTASPPILPPDKLNRFIKDVFHNSDELYVHHRHLVDKFHKIQLDQHPKIRSIAAAMLDAVLNFRDAYMEYISNYPIAAYRIDDEIANNPAFKAFVDQCVCQPGAHGLDMKSFINRPVPRMFRYELLLKAILDETPSGHEDRKEIPLVLEVIKSLGKDIEPGVVTAKQKVELWRNNSNSPPPGRDPFGNSTGLLSPPAQPNSSARFKMKTSRRLTSLLKNYFPISMSVNDDDGESKAVHTLEAAERTLMSGVETESSSKSRFRFMGKGSRKLAPLLPRSPSSLPMEVDVTRTIPIDEATARNESDHRLASVKNSADLSVFIRDDDAGLPSQQTLLGLDAASVQRIMHLLQSELDREAYDSFGTNPAKYRKKCLRLLRQFSKTYQVLPHSLMLPDAKRHGMHPVAGGGYADIWRGSVAEKPVCLKVLRLIMEPDEETRDRIRKNFCHEALVWRQLKHPNILPLLGVNAELFSPSFCLISPWMDNGDIITYLKHNPDHDLHRTFSDIAAGLYYLHSRDPPITHGDIRGANILVTPDARCCLADFGLTLVSSESGSWSAAATSTGTMKGAIRWMAPELLFGNTSDIMQNFPSRDLYAFGCTVVEILTLKPPFHYHKTEPLVLLALQMGERPSRPSHIWCTDIVWDFVKHCWAEIAEERPNSMKPHTSYQVTQPPFDLKSRASISGTGSGSQVASLACSPDGRCSDINVNDFDLSGAGGTTTFACQNVNLTGDAASLFGTCQVTG